jgi:hypothetical protein
LRLHSSTRRLSSNNLSADQAIEFARTEIRNGELLVSKLHPRIAVLQRAVALLENPMQSGRIMQGVGAGEAGFTRQVSQMLREDARALRQVQVALSQWEQATNGLAAVQDGVQKALEVPESHRASFVESHCHVEKLRGQLYPLINLHVVFRENPLLSQLIPTPKQGTGELTAASKPSEVPPAPKPEATRAPEAASLESEVKAVDAAVAQVVDSLKQATGNLKNKLIGLLGGVPKDQA